MAPVLALDGPSRFYGKLLGGSGRVLVLGAGDGLVARERFSDFNEAPFSPEAQLQVVVGGPA